MIVEKRRLEGMILLDIEGVIKLGESAAFFVETLQRSLLEEEGHVIIDFSKISQMDSTGLGELIDYLGRFREHNRQLVLINPADRIRHLLNTSGLKNLFTTFETTEAALKALT
jgi:anti-anti-sigma factor